MDQVSQFLTSSSIINAQEWGHSLTAIPSLVLRDMHQAFVWKSITVKVLALYPVTASLVLTLGN